MSDPITSPTNRKIKLVRSLQTRSRTRKSEGAFVAEGVRLVEEALFTQWKIDFLLYDETLSNRGKVLIESLDKQGSVDVAEISPQLMAEVSDTETPQGILAVLRSQTLTMPASPGFVIIADQIRDPGNLGTLLRTAEAVGADAVILTPGTVDAFSPKVVRAGMGAHFHLPVFDRPWETITSLIKNLPVFLADSGADIPLWDANFIQPCALLIGGEAFGASARGESIATHRVTIPMLARAESLNAAIAAGILMAEVLRQRSQNKKD